MRSIGHELDSVEMLLQRAEGAAGPARDVLASDASLALGRVRRRSGCQAFQPRIDALGKRLFAITRVA